jgi:hypothetical protein
MWTSLVVFALALLATGGGSRVSASVGVCMVQPLKPEEFSNLGESYVLF